MTHINRITRGLAVAVMVTATTQWAKGTPWVDPGVSIQDADPNVTVTVSGTVNTSRRGDYVITYTARDSSGNTSQAQRIVQVR